MIYKLSTKCYSRLSPRRRQELDLALRDLNHDSQDQSCTLKVYPCRNGGVQLVVSTAGGEPDIAELTFEALEPHLNAYGDIIGRMVKSTTGDGARSLETLDYAKRLIHDEAGELVQEALDELTELPLPEARRLFTLIYLVESQAAEDVVAGHRIHLSFSR